MPLILTATLMASVHPACASIDQAAAGRLPRPIAFKDGAGDFHLLAGFDAVRIAHEAPHHFVLIDLVDDVDTLDAAIARVRGGLPIEPTPDDAAAPTSPRRTHAAKRAQVITYLQDPEARLLSDRAVARACLVSQPFVGALRRALADNKILSPRHWAEGAQTKGPPAVLAGGPQTVLPTACVSAAAGATGTCAETLPQPRANGIGQVGRVAG